MIPADPPRTARSGDGGVVLINVLIVLALASTVVYAMLSLAELAVRRSQTYSSADQALDLIRSGEATAISALRRDMTEAPAADSVSEPWGRVAQSDIEIAGGRFSLAVEDAAGKLNLNSVRSTGLAGQALIRNILTALGLPDAVGLRIAARLEGGAPLTRLQDLAGQAGVTPDDIAKLATMVTVLPARSDININAAPVALIAVLAQNPVRARFLDKTRTRKGSLTQADVTAAGITLPPGVAYRSDFFRVTTRVTVGDTTQAMTSLLQRRRGADGQPEVVVVAREKAGAAVSPPPPR